MRRVEIIWTDITYKDAGWSHKNDVDDFISDTKENKVCQLGYIYKETDDMVVLVDSYFFDERTYGTIQKIPRAVIISITDVK